MRQYRLSALLAASGIGILLLLMLLPTTATPVQINDTYRDSTIAFSVSRNIVAFPGECVMVRWDVQNIQAVYLNDSGEVGTGERELCLNDSPELRVVFEDESEQIYPSGVVILAQSPLFWLAILTALILIVTAAIQLLPARDDSSRLVRLVAAAIPVVVGIVLALLLLEVGLRIYFTTAGTRDQRIMYVYSLQEIRELDPLTQPLPYVNYIPAPGHPEHNALGYRGPETTVDKPDGVFRIVAMGGSTTYSTGTDVEHSYPAQLERILREDYGYTQVEVINAGFLGYSSWETLVNLAFRVLELEPDIILLYAAVNDVLPREQASLDCYAGDNALHGINWTRGLWVERDAPLSPSVLHRFVGVTLGLLPNPLALDSTFELPDIDCEPDPETITTAERVDGNPPVYFERNLRNIIALAQANNVQPVISTWVYYLDADRPDHWREAIREHNAISRILSENYDVPLIDLVASFPLDGSYWEPDGIHMVDSGALEQAQQYAAFLDESGLIPQP